jgi:uncharacterized protein with FMN-binding domain
MPLVKSSNPNKKVANSLVAVSSVAVLAVYAAGFVKTKAAADKFVQQADDGRPRQAPPARPQVLEASLRTIPAPAPAPVETTIAPKPAAKAEAPVAETAPAATPAPSAVPAPVAVAAPAAAPAAVPVPVVPAVAAAPLSPPGPFKDGVWKAWGTCRHGDLEAAIKIENGKITQAGVSDCQTRYSCDIIDRLPPQVIRKQSADVDRVGGATQSSDAFYYAIYEAMRLSAEAYKAAPAAAAAAPASPAQSN